MINLKFKATKEMPSYNGRPDGSVIRCSSENADKLKKDYPGCFTIENKAVEPPSKLLVLTPLQKRAGYKIVNGKIVDKKGKAVNAPESNK